MSKLYRNGLVVGKFSPLHKGHEYLLDHASLQCEQLHIISYSHPEFAGCEAARRERWLQQRFPHARCLVVTPELVAQWQGAGLAIPDMPGNDAGDEPHRRFTAMLCSEVLQLSVDAVFSSEDYGPGFAAALAQHFGRPVAHVMVDAGRVAVPASGTRIRDDVHAERALLAPEVYRDFVRRIAFVGGESCGKSTLCQALAQAFDTQWVPEYGRTLWVERDGKLDFADYLHIAETQLAHEQAGLLQAQRYLFCDTTPLTTLLYCLDQFGAADPKLEQLARLPYDRIYLCAPDFPLVQDGWRRDEAFRHSQHAWYLERLDSLGLEYALISGGHVERMAHLMAQLTPPDQQHTPSKRDT